MKFLKEIIIVTGLLSLFIGGHAQGGGVDDYGSNIYPNIMPPSPTAGNLGSISNIDVGLFTGTPNVSIPLYELKGKNLSIPITLNYSSSGIKVDEIASWVGQGWNLSAGGVITRVVRDMPDEEGGFYTLNEYGMNPETADFIINTASPNLSYDTEPDMFSFNFLGYSGKFIMTKTGIKLIPYQNIKIEIGGADSFIITTPDGVKFHFGGVIGFSKSLSDCSASGISNTPLPTEWFLTKIEHPLGDVINFNYKTTTYSYHSVIQETMKVLIESDNCPGGEDCPEGPGYPESCVSKNMVLSSGILTEIIYENVGTVKFESSKGRLDLDDYQLDRIVVYNGTKPIKSFDFQYHTFKCNGSNSKVDYYAPDVIYRMFLRSLQELNGDETIPPYEFVYDAIDFSSVDCSLSQRLSFAQDYWGYYNGENNTSLVPYNDITAGIFGNIGGNREPNFDYAKKGILTKVIYPTGGYKKISYEGNSKFGTVKHFPIQKSFNVMYDGYRIGSKTFLFDIDIEQYRDGRFSFWSCNEGSIGCRGFGSLIDPDGETVASFTDDGYIVLKPWTLDKTGQYSIHLFGRNFGINGGDEYFAVGAGITYDNAEPYETQENIPWGGMRVSRISTMLPGKEENIRKFYYNTYENRNESSAVINSLPISFGYLNTGFDCNGVISECKYGILHSNTQVPMYLSGNNPVSYEYVTESFGNNFKNGGITYKYEIASDIPGNNWHGNNILGVPYSNTGWKNGRKLYEETFIINEGSKKTQTKKEFTYAETDFNKSTVKGVYVRKNYNPTLFPPFEYVCKEQDLDKIRYDVKCNANHYHIWVLGKPIGPVNYLLALLHGYKPEMNQYCAAPNADMELIPYPHPCYGKEVGDIITNVSALDPYDIYIYDVISEWSYLKKTTLTKYDKNGENPISFTTNYLYDNPEHALMTSEIQTDNLGKSVINSYKYPFDYDVFGYCQDEYNTCYQTYETNKQACIDLCPIDENLKFCILDCIETLSSDIDVCNTEYQNCMESFSGDDQTNALGYMQNNYIYTPVIETMQSIKPESSLENITNGIITKYKLDEYNHIVKNEVYKFSDQNINSANYTESNIDNGIFEFQDESFSKVLVFDKYDEQGNPVEYHKEDDIHSVILYAYNYTLPVAEIINATFTDVETALTSIGESVISINDKSLMSSDESELITLFTDLRSALSDKNITSITYDPMIGKTTITDSNGKINYYVYDDLGRLTVVKDQDGNIVQTNEYQYHDSNNIPKLEAITGPDAVTSGTEYTFYVPELTGAESYHWKVPDDAVMTPKSNTSVGVTFKCSGTVSVYAESSTWCDYTYPVSKQVIASPPSITKNEWYNKVDIGVEYTFSIHSVAGADSYHWDYPETATLISDNGSSISLILYCDGAVSVYAESSQWCKSTNTISEIVDVIENVSFVPTPQNQIFEHDGGSYSVGFDYDGCENNFLKVEYPELNYLHLQKNIDYQNNTIGIICPPAVSSEIITQPVIFKNTKGNGYAEFNVTRFGILVVNETGTNPNGPATEIILTPEGGSGNYAYTWYDENDNVIPGKTDNTLFIYGGWGNTVIRKYKVVSGNQTKVKTLTVVFPNH